MYTNDLILSYLMILDYCGTVWYILLFPPCVCARADVVTIISLTALTNAQCHAVSILCGLVVYKL